MGKVRKQHWQPKHLAEEEVVLVEDDTSVLERENSQLRKQLATEKRARKALMTSSQRLKTVFSEQMKRLSAKYQEMSTQLKDTETELAELKQRDEVEANAPYPMKVRLDVARAEARRYQLQYSKLLWEFEIAQGLREPTKLRVQAKPWKSSLKPNAPEFVLGSPRSQSGLKVDAPSSTPSHPLRSTPTSQTMMSSKLGPAQILRWLP